MHMEAPIDPDVPTVTSHPKLFSASFIIISVLLFLGGVVVGSLLVQKSRTPLKPPSAACTTEAKLCPDGASVGRTGPNCEFAPCPTKQISPTETPRPTPDKNGDCPAGFYNYGVPLGCVTKDVIENCKHNPCPICLSSSTMISTPNGNINVKSIKPGMIVWTMNAEYQKVAAPVIKTTSTVVPSTHKMIHLVLKDGRELFVSPGHISITGQPAGELRVGEAYDHSIITGNELVPYNDTRTYDLLPAGDTGFYWANDILVGSTLK